MSDTEDDSIVEMQKTKSEKDEIKKEKKKKRKRKKKRRREEEEEENEVENDKEQEKENDTAPQETEDERNEGDETNNAEETTRKKRKRKRKKKETTVTASKDDASAENSLSSAQDSEVYIEGIPFDCTEEDVKIFFVSNGCQDVTQIRLPKWQDSGRLRGYGHVAFSTSASQQKALALSGEYIRNRYVTIQIPKARNDVAVNQAPPAQPPKCRTIFVKNLPYEITEEDLEDAFRSYGKIAKGGVRLALNSTTNLPKGFGYVEFKATDGAFEAVTRAFSKGLFMKGRKLVVDYEEKPMKGSFRSKEGKLWKSEFPKRVGKY